MIEIVILKNMHPYPELQEIISNAASFEDIPVEFRKVFIQTAESHHQVIKFIANNTMPYIVENEDVYKAENEEYKKIIQAAFINGIPEQFSQLNFFQQRILAHYTGIFTAVNLGFVNQTYSDNLAYVNQKKSYLNRLHITSPKSMAGRVMIDSGREFLVINQAICTARELKTDKIGVIYGDAHNQFTQVAACYKKIKLTFMNFAKSFQDEELYIQFKKKYNEEIYNHPINCTFFSTQFSKNPPMLNNCNFEVPTPDSSLDQGGKVGIVLLMGLIVFGLFRYFKPSSFHQNKAPYEKPSPQEETHKSKRKSRHRKS